jgi:hypothetical protein
MNRLFNRDALGKSEVGSTWPQLKPKRFEMGPKLDRTLIIRRLIRVCLDRSLRVRRVMPFRHQLRKNKSWCR